MKNKDKVISDRKIKIESNNLEIISFGKLDFIEKIHCKCKNCGQEIFDNYRNLSYKKFKCKYCILNSTSELVKSNQIKILHIDGDKISIICKNGHSYKQDRRNLLAGKNCSKCYINGKVFSKEEIQKKFCIIHGDYYKYDFSDFKNLHSKIKITCEKNHSFNQKVSNHLQGKGCPICRESLGERIVSKFLRDKNINYIRQKRFDDCKFKCTLPFDFYLPELSVAIEFDGVQHFYPIKRFGGEKEFQKTVIKDQIKTEYCKNNNIKLFRISYDEDIHMKLSNIYELVIFQSQIGWI